MLQSGFKASVGYTANPYLKKKTGREKDGVQPGGGEQLLPGSRPSLYRTVSSQAICWPSSIIL